jgi:hypothetical protein
MDNLPSPIPDYKWLFSSLKQPFFVQFLISKFQFLNSNFEHPTSDILPPKSEIRTEAKRSSPKVNPTSDIRPPNRSEAELTEGKSDI